MTTEIDAEGLASRRRHRWSAMTADEAFDASYIPEPNSGCWIWDGPAQATKPGGGGLRPTFHFRGRRTYAYRFSYERSVGEIPNGLIICHRCNNPLCVNPGHLYAGTHLQNIDDAIRGGTHTSLALRKRAEQRAAENGREHVPRKRDLAHEREFRRQKRRLAAMGSTKR